MESDVKAHYHTPNLTQTLLWALEQAGKDLACLTVKDLAPVDQLHTGGARATLDLIPRAGLPPNARILDAGCGLGGSSRLLAHTFQYQVIGIDLADSFVDAGTLLTERCGLSDRVTLRQGSILDLPREIGEFDAILCQHILMNIKDKPRALAEFYRVLKPGGILILHEIFKGPGPEPVLPVPWASRQDLSFLAPWPAMASWLEASGFTPCLETDQTPPSLAWWQRINQAPKKHPPRPLGPHLVFGKNAARFGPNMEQNFKTRAIVCMEVLFSKV